MRIFCAITALIALQSLASVSAHAQSNPRTQSSEDDAKRLYQRALLHYNLMEYEEAIADFKAAYLITNAPELLFDIGQAYRRRGTKFCVHALEFFRNYRNAEKDPAKRAKADSLITEMETCVTRDTPAVAGTSPAPIQVVSSASPHSAVETPPTRDLALPISLGVAGFAVAAGGGTLWLWSHREYQSLQTTCSPNCNPADLDAPRNRRTAGILLLATGGIAMSFATLLILLGDRRPSTRTTVWISPSTQGLQFGGHF